MLKTELMALCQEKTNQQKAQEYSAYVQRKRRLKKAVTGIIVAAFFIAAFGSTGKSDLETLKAKEIDVVIDTTEGR